MSYIVKVRAGNKVLKTTNPADVARFCSLYIPSVVWKAVLIHGAEVQFCGTQLTREIYATCDPLITRRIK